MTRARPDRPGSRAATEHAVLRPLADAGMTKADVRAIARVLDLPVADKPAAPCLASRIPHFETVTPEKLRQIDQAEAALRRLGLGDLRVRHHGDGGPGRADRSGSGPGGPDAVARARSSRPYARPGSGSSPWICPASSRGRSPCRWSRSIMTEPDTRLAEFADLDHDRLARRGYPEAVYCAGKTPEQLRVIAAGVRDLAQVTLFTRADDDHAAAVLRRAAGRPLGRRGRTAGLAARRRRIRPGGLVVIVAAGTSDLRVAREAMLTAQYLGRPTASWSSTSGSPACTASSGASTCCARPGWSSSSPAWTARCPAWWPA